MLKSQACNWKINVSEADEEEIVATSNTDGELFQGTIQEFELHLADYGRVGEVISPVSTGVAYSDPMCAFYVDGVSGNDQNDGSRTAPFKTLAHTSKFLNSRCITNTSLFDMNETPLSPTLYLQNIKAVDVNGDNFYELLDLQSVRVDIYSTVGEFKSEFKVNAISSEVGLYEVDSGGARVVHLRASGSTVTSQGELGTIVAHRSLVESFGVITGGTINAGHSSVVLVYGPFGTPSQGPALFCYLNSLIVFNNVAPPEEPTPVALYAVRTRSSIQFTGCDPADFGNVNNSTVDGTSSTVVHNGE